MSDLSVSKNIEPKTNAMAPAAWSTKFSRQGDDFYAWFLENTRGSNAVSTNYISQWDQQFKEVSSHWSGLDRRLAEIDENREEETVIVNYSGMIRACEEATQAPLITLSKEDFQTLAQIQTSFPIMFEIEYDEE